MKKRSLLFSFLTVFVSAAILVFSSAWIDGDKVTTQGTDDARMEQIVKAQQYYSMLRNNQVTGRTDAGDVVQAAEDALKLMNHGSRVENMDWIELGSDNFAGRVRSVLVDNRDQTGNTIYAGSVYGGIWKSTNGGLTWSKTNGAGLNLNVSCMVQAANGTIYVGTGESFLKEVEDMSWFEGALSRGLYKSTDGETFSLITGTVPQQTAGVDADWAYINRLAVDQNSGRIYAALNNGLLYSDNDGQSWNLAKTAEGDTLMGNAFDVDVAADGTVAASVNGWFYISSGNGNQFMNMSTMEVVDDSTINPNKLPKNYVAGIEVAIAPSDNNIVYAMVIADDDPDNDYVFGDLNGIYMSSDKGANWRIIGPGGSEDFDIVQGFGTYASELVVMPNDAYTILAGGVTMWEGKQFNPDGYFGWAQKSSVFAFLPTYVELYHHDYVFANGSSSTIYIATDAGLYKSSDALASFKSLNKTLNIDQFNSVAYTFDDKVLGGAQVPGLGYGILYFDGEGNTEETAAGIGEVLINDIGGFCEASMIKPACFIVAGTNDNLQRSDDHGANYSPVFLSGDIANANGFITPFALWECFNNPNTRDSVAFEAEMDYAANDVIKAHSYNNDYPFDYVTPVAVSAGETIMIPDPVSSRFLIAVQNSVFMTKQVLDFTIEPEWFEIAEIVGIPQCIAYSKDANYVFVGTQDGKLYRIANLALAYDFDRADVSSPSCIVSTEMIAEMEDRVITSVAVDPNDANHIVFTMGNYGNDDYIYQSTNALAFEPVFESIQGNLPKMPVYSSLIELSNSNRLIVGTELGIYATEDLSGNVVWTFSGQGMGTVPAYMMRQQMIDHWSIKNYGAIYVATHGRGLFKSQKFVGINDPAQGNNNTISSVSIFPNPVASRATVTFESDNQNVEIFIYDLNSRLVKTLEYNLAGTGQQEVSVDLNGLGLGTYILQVVAGNESTATKFMVVK